MKNYIKLVFIYLLLFACSLNLSMAQNEMFPDGRQYFMRMYRPPYFGNMNEVFMSVVNGDTIVNGRYYQKVYEYGYPVLLRWDKTKLYRYFDKPLPKDSLVFDESWVLNDETNWVKYDTVCRIAEVGELQGRKFWRTDEVGIWLQGIGYIDTWLFNTYNQDSGSANCELICCIDPGNDTLYVNRDYLYMLKRVSLPFLLLNFS